MLTLIGLGLHSESDLSLQALEEAKNSDKIYIELYTSKWHGNLENLSKLIGKEITELERKNLEENSNSIIEEAKSKKVSIFVQGDPLIQTTHSSLLMDARKSGIETKIIHNSSIVTAIGETGLHLQKFGPYVTIPFPEKTKGKLPQSVFEVIRENKKRGLHTLCLLDVMAEEDRIMTIADGLQILLSGEVITKEDNVIAFAKAGSEKPVIAYDSTDSFIKNNSKDTPAVIIIPGKLHFTEEQYLELIKHG